MFVEGCVWFGIDFCRDLVFVVFVVYYLMGGIVIDVQGATSIAGLFASGESACTGAYGANRLASNLLFECFVFVHRVVAVGLDVALVVAVDGSFFDRSFVWALFAEFRCRMWDEADPMR